MKRRISCTTMHRQLKLSSSAAAPGWSFCRVQLLTQSNSKLESQFPGSKSTQLHHLSYKNVFKSEGCANSLFFIFSRLIWVFEPQTFEVTGWERTCCLSNIFLKIMTSFWITSTLWKLPDFLPTPEEIRQCKCW